MRISVVQKDSSLVALCLRCGTLLSRMLSSMFSHRGVPEQISMSQNRSMPANQSLTVDEEPHSMIASIHGDGPPRPSSAPPMAQGFDEWENEGAGKRLLPMPPGMPTRLPTEKTELVSKDLRRQPALILCWNRMCPLICAHKTMQI